ncbi:MAG: hypothetical protein QOG56_834, partial [Solirubrobacteraceae bacterium]|nr:hypothetical protein [Solirubrobacteraceae bacterium]
MDAAADGRQAPAGGDRGHGHCPDGSHPPCCPLYHEAVELIGR